MSPKCIPKELIEFSTISNGSTEREGKTRSICYAHEEMNTNLISKEKAHVLPGSIIVMETGSVNRLCAFESSAGGRG